MQSKNKNDSVQFPTRYQCYDFAKRHLGKESRPEIFPIGETTQGSIRVSKRGKHQQDIVYDTDGIMTSLSAGTHGSSKHLTKIADYRYDEGLRIRKNNICPTLKARGRVKDISGSPLVIPSILRNTRIRRLTLIECERLQSFPDNFTKYGINEKGKQVKISDSQRYKVLGNAVTVNVIKEIMLKMLKMKF